MTFEIAADDGGTAVVTITGELDIGNIDSLRIAAEPIIQSGPDRLIVDVAQLRFADSSAIALWVRWAAVIGEIELRDPPPLIRQVISSMGLAQKLRITP
ncbi:MAG TPA: STAS domain-containing protein [Solirubrobacteraceae bacterium]|nr:STAS domain-containing protein [Solirubrobacteraceae bacterium]